MTKLIAVLERLEKRYANEHALCVLSAHEAHDESRGWYHAQQAAMVAKRDLCRDLREALSASAKALPEGGGSDAR